MRRVFIFLAACGLATPLESQIRRTVPAPDGLTPPPPLPAPATPRQFDFSIANIMRGPELYGRPPGVNPASLGDTRPVQWSADSRWIYFHWVPAGSDWRDVPRVHRVRAAAGARPELVPAAQLDTVGPLLASGDFNYARTMKAVEHDGDIYLVDLRRGSVRRLTETVAREFGPRFSGQQNRVFFIRDNNVYSVDLSGGSLTQHTDLRLAASPADSIRRADSLARVGQRGFLTEQQRELFDYVRDRVRADSIRRADSLERAGRRLQPIYLGRNERLGALSISPNANALILVLSTPAEGDRQAVIPRWVTESGYTEEVRPRDKVGDVQTRTRLAFVTLPTGRVTWLAPFGADTAAGFINTRGWNRAGTHALLLSRSFDNKQRALQTIDLSGTLRDVDRLRDTAWVGGPCFTCSGWYDEGRRVWYVSEADGWAHLYTARPDGSDRRQLTQGRWEVRDVALSPDERTFHLHTNEPSPFERQFYRMSVNGGARQRITSWSGSHEVVVSPDQRLLANVYSYVNQPPDLFLIKNRPGAAMQRLTLSSSDEWRSHEWLAPEIVMIPASDGVQIPAHIYRPEEVGAQPNGAAVMFIHGAGYLQNVGNFWSEYPREYMFNQYLASRGYVVLDIDYRHSSGYGRDFRTAVYRWLGGRDLQDAVDASRWLQSTHEIPGERVGIYGGSYGGFITLMALFTEQQHFGAGAALRSVTDWAHYNQGWTSNILNQPQNDAEAYRRSSPIYFAEGLQDPLVILHGMEDTNVHFQDVVRLTQRLIELGKENWELAVYPVEDHAFVRPSSWADEYRRIYEIFQNNLPARTRTDE
ncbi:prolyl oligopeptidase family serine peptidase [soil metagenome]